MNIAVTGSTGQLGRLVIEKLLQEGAANVIAVARDETKARSLAEAGAEIRLSDYTDPATLQAAFTGVDRLLLISSSELDGRVEQHGNAIAAAGASGVQHILYTSGTKATETPLILAADHKATEAILHQCGMAYTILRNNWYTENYVPTVEAARQTGAIYAAAGDGRVPSATRRDYAEGAAAVLLGSGHEGKIYELGGDSAWDYYELARVVSEIIGQPVEYRPVDAATLGEILQSAGLDEQTAGFVAALDGNIAAGALDHVTGDLSRLIGRPTTPLKEGLAAAVS